MKTLPRMDMTGWTIDSFELAYDGLQSLNAACRLIQNQPRSEVRNGEYHPGADFIVSIGEDWCSAQIDALIERVGEVRFGDRQHDERRVLLLINYASSHGSASDPLASIIQMALDQSVRPA
ncbi:MAG: hypothetical protein IH616_23275 [Gemmatimonadales bacterium]|nr:hypothetical protein [Gemmatimonadales bacterium]